MRNVEGGELNVGTLVVGLQSDRFQELVPGAFEIVCLVVEVREAEVIAGEIGFDLHARLKRRRNFEGCGRGRLGRGIRRQFEADLEREEFADSGKSRIGFVQVEQLLSQLNSLFGRHSNSAGTGRDPRQRGRRGGWHQGISLLQKFSLLLLHCIAPVVFLEAWTDELQGHGGYQERPRARRTFLYRRVAFVIRGVIVAGVNQGRAIGEMIDGGGGVRVRTHGVGRLGVRKIVEQNSGTAGLLDLVEERGCHRKAEAPGFDEVRNVARGILCREAAEDFSAVHGRSRDGLGERVRGRQGGGQRGDEDAVRATQELDTEIRETGPEMGLERRRTSGAMNQ